MQHINNSHQRVELEKGFVASITLNLRCWTDHNKHSEMLRTDSVYSDIEAHIYKFYRIDLVWLNLTLSPVIF